MNRALPPGDRGSRGADPRWTSGRGGLVSRAGGLVGGTPFGGTPAAAGRQESVTADVPLWAAFPSLGLMPQPRRPGRNVGARSRNTGRSRATFAARGGGL